MNSRFQLLCYGLYPETLPPCFVSTDAKRAFHGIVKNLDKAQFYERKTEYVRYNCTKHDGSRRFFGTPNIISYFHITSFIWKNWTTFVSNFAFSNYSVGCPNIIESEERALKIPSLSELSKHCSRKLSYAPFVLKADISQCFPSLYTHSISWAAHGIETSKRDTQNNSSNNSFNALDFFVRNCQKGNTRGVLVGPDAFRLIAEFVLSRLDSELALLVGDKIVGAVRHVDDYYIGLRSEHDAQAVLSSLREVLASYELNLNDNKTAILSSLEPINDLWAQRLRSFLHPLNSFNETHLEHAFSEAIQTAKDQKTDSPIKILLRSLDEHRIYQGNSWEFTERYLQRIVQKHVHALDYACLLVVKRHAIGEDIDKVGWSEVADIIIRRSLAFDHHHEVLWMMWLLLICDIPFKSELIELLSSSRNSHIRSLLIKAYSTGKLKRKPKLSLGSSLATTDSNWLTNLVAKAEGFSGASFSGLYSSEFTHLANRQISLIDFDWHINKIRQDNQNAISRTRYGYDDDDWDEDDDWDDEDWNDERNPF